MHAFSGRLKKSIALHSIGNVSLSLRFVYICQKYFRLTESLPSVNFSPMSPKFLLTYPHREEDRGIAMASLFLRLMLLKVLSNQLKIFVKLNFSPKVWPFCLFWFTMKLSLECCESSRKEATFWFCYGENVNMLKQGLS